jgi:hypothetical protein
LQGCVGAPPAASLVRAAAWRVRRTAEAPLLGRFSHLPATAMRRLDIIRGLR